MDENHTNQHEEVHEQFSGQNEIVLPASATQRLIHFLLDSFLMYLIFIFLIIILPFEAFNNVYNFSSSVLYWVVTLLYYLFFEYKFSRTPAKMVTGTIVVSKTGDSLTFKQVLSRTICRAIPLEMLSFALYGTYPVKGWHDRFSNTLVVPKNLSRDKIALINQDALRGVGKKTSIVRLLLIIFGLPLLFVLLTLIIIS